MPRPEFEKFIATITKVTDPESTVVLFGYLGPSPEKGKSYVFTDLTLRKRLLVSDDDFVHAERIRADEPLSGSYFWIKADAKVIHRNTQVKASFLQGGIQRQYEQSPNTCDPCCVPPPAPIPSPLPDCPGGTPYPCPSVPPSRGCSRGTY